MASLRRSCAAMTLKGRSCGAAPPLDSDFCLFHDPEQRDAAAAARRAGGLRRRRSASMEAILDIGDIRTTEGLASILKVALDDLVILDNSVARARALIALVSAGARLQHADLERRVEALEAGAMPDRRADDPTSVEGTLLDGTDLR